MLTQMGETDLASSIQGINLPSSEFKDKIENRRLIVYVSVEKNGHFRFGGNIIGSDELLSHLSESHQNLPNLIIGVMADKDCKMEHINDLIMVLRKSHCLRVFFYVQKNNSV